MVNSNDVLTVVSSAIASYAVVFGTYYLVINSYRDTIEVSTLLKDVAQMKRCHKSIRNARIIMAIAMILLTSCWYVMIAAVLQSRAMEKFAINLITFNWF